MKKYITKYQMYLIKGVAKGRFIAVYKGEGVTYLGDSYSALVIPNDDVLINTSPTSHIKEASFEAMHRVFIPNEKAVELKPYGEPVKQNGLTIVQYVDEDFNSFFIQKDYASIFAGTIFKAAPGTHTIEVWTKEDYVHIGTIACVRGKEGK